MKTLILLLLIPSFLFADQLEKQYAKKEKQLKEKKLTFEEQVAETLTFEEYAEWLALRQKFEARENNEKEQQLACITNGTNPKTCVDPHWCLYPTKLNTDQCVWYKIKYDI
jgi:hypothetical protein